MNLDETYRKNPQLREYYTSLPGTVRMQIIDMDIQVMSLGELQKLAQGLMNHF